MNDSFNIPGNYHSEQKLNLVSIMVGICQHVLPAGNETKAANGWRVGGETETGNRRDGPAQWHGWLCIIKREESPCTEAYRFVGKLPRGCRSSQFVIVRIVERIDSRVSVFGTSRKCVIGKRCCSESDRQTQYVNFGCHYAPFIDCSGIRAGKLIFQEDISCFLRQM